MIFADEAGELAVEEVQGSGVVGEVLVGEGGTADVGVAFGDFRLAHGEFDLAVFHGAEAALGLLDLDEVAAHLDFGIVVRGAGSEEQLVEDVVFVLVFGGEDGVGLEDAVGDGVLAGGGLTFGGARSGGLSGVGVVGGELAFGGGFTRSFVFHG